MNRQIRIPLHCEEWLRLQLQNDPSSGRDLSIFHSAFYHTIMQAHNACMYRVYANYAARLRRCECLVRATDEEIWFHAVRGLHADGFEAALDDENRIVFTRRGLPLFNDRDCPELTRI